MNFFRCLLTILFILLVQKQHWQGTRQEVQVDNNNLAMGLSFSGDNKDNSPMAHVMLGYLKELPGHPTNNWACSLHFMMSVKDNNTCILWVCLIPKLPWTWNICQTRMITRHQSNHTSSSLYYTTGFWEQTINVSPYYLHVMS